MIYVLCQHCYSGMVPVAINKVIYCPFSKDVICQTNIFLLYNVFEKYTTKETLDNRTPQFKLGWIIIMKVVIQSCYSLCTHATAKNNPFHWIWQVANLTSFGICYALTYFINVTMTLTKFFEIILNSFNYYSFNKLHHDYVWIYIFSNFFLIILLQCNVRYIYYILNPLS